MYILKYVLEAALEISPQLPACDRYESTQVMLEKAGSPLSAGVTPFKDRADPSLGGRSVSVSQWMLGSDYKPGLR